MLLAIALAGGSLGAVAARARFRHKTRKQPFSVLLWCICGLQAGLVLWMGALGPRAPLDALSMVVNRPPAFTDR